MISCKKNFYITFKIYALKCCNQADEITCCVIQLLVFYRDVVVDYGKCGKMCPLPMPLIICYSQLLLSAALNRCSSKDDLAYYC